MGKGDNLVDGVVQIYEAARGGTSFDVYRKGDARIGGRDGRLLDPAKVERLLLLMNEGATLRTACRMSGLPHRVVESVVDRGEELLEDVELSRGERWLTEEEDECAWFASLVLELEGSNQFLSEVGIRQTLLGKAPLSLGRFAADILSRLDPEGWDRKNKLKPFIREPLGVGTVSGEVGDEKTSRQLAEERMEVESAVSEKVAKLREESRDRADKLGEDTDAG